MRLMEFTQTDDQSTQEDGIIRNVLILGSNSRNRRKYTPEAMSKAATLYEGKEVYTDHPTSIDRDRKGRAAADRFGVIKNAHFVESANGPQLRGDLHHLTTHPLSPRVEEDRRRNLQFFGLSHLADGTGHTEKGTNMTIVESIDRVHEVDLVSNAATAVSLMEQEEMAAVAPVEKTKEEMDAEEADRQKDMALESGVLAILKNPEIPVEEKGEKIMALFAAHITVHAEEEKEEEEEEVAEEPVKAAEQTAIDSAAFKALSEQVTAQAAEVASLKAELAKKPRKFLAPAAPAPLVLAEQAQTIPNDKDGLNRWFHTRDDR